MLIRLKTILVAQAMTEQISEAVMWARAAIKSMVMAAMSDLLIHQTCTQSQTEGVAQLTQLAALLAKVAEVAKKLIMPSRTPMQTLQLPLNNLIKHLLVLAVQDHQMQQNHQK